MTAVVGTQGPIPSDGKYIGGSTEVSPSEMFGNNYRRRREPAILFEKKSVPCKDCREKVFKILQEVFSVDSLEEHCKNFPTRLLQSTKTWPGWVY